MANRECLIEWESGSAATADLFEDTVVRYGQADEGLGFWHLARILGCTGRQVNERKMTRKMTRTEDDLSRQNENVRFEQSRNVRFRGSLEGPNGTC